MTNIFDEARSTAVLAGPLVAAQLAQVGLGLGASTALGALGRNELAGGALGLACFSTALVICGGLLSSVATLGAEREAVGERGGAAGFAATGLLIGGVVSGFVVIGLLNAATVFFAVGGDAAATSQMTGFLRSAAWGFPFAVGSVVLRNLATAVGKTTAFAVYATSGAIMGTALAHAAARGALGPQARGAPGVGAVVTAVHAIVFLAMAVHSVRAGWLEPAAFSCSRLRQRRSGIALVLRIGAPVAVLYGLESGMFSVTTLWASALGVDAIVAHHVAVQSSYLTFMVPSGIGMATAARVGRAFSTLDRAAVVRAIGVGLCGAMLFMAATGGVFWAAPRWVVRLFFDVDAPASAPAVVLASQTLAAVAVFQIADAVQGVTAGALRGLRDTKIPMVLGVVSYWGVGVALAYCLGLRAGVGVAGLWWGLAAGLAAAAVALSVRLAAVVRRLERP